MWSISATMPSSPESENKNEKTPPESLYGDPGSVFLWAVDKAGGGGVTWKKP